jgi:uncharacterized protein YqhQ
LCDYVCVGVRLCSSFIRSFFRSLVVHPIIPSFVSSFIRSFVHSVIRSFVHSFLRSFVHSFIRSFVHLFICSFAQDGHLALVMCLI